jgi:hypothetical protein
VNHNNTSELKATDYERLRHVMQSSLIGELHAGASPSSTTFTVRPTNTVIGTAAILANELAWIGWIVLD